MLNTLELCTNRFKYDARDETLRSYTVSPFPSGSTGLTDDDNWILGQQCGRISADPQQHHLLRDEGMHSKKHSRIVVVGYGGLLHGHSHTATRTRNMLEAGCWSNPEICAPGERVPCPGCNRKRCRTAQNEASYTRVHSI